MAEATQLTDDRLLDGRLRLSQPARGYRVAIDPVLLAAAVPAGAGDRVLDAGCGTGAAALCLAFRVGGCGVTGLELLAQTAAVARLNIAANDLANRVEIMVGDLREPPAELKVSFDQVMSNPPYVPESYGTPPPDSARRAAHAESIDLAAWVAACLRRLRPGGWLTMIQRADRLPDLLTALSGKAGDVTILPLWPRADAVAGRVIVRARKGSRGPAVLARGLVLHEEDGRFTPEAEAVLRHGAPLEVRR
jgi:tRNA1(Val) A37 N6-methylase TrmN6